MGNRAKIALWIAAVYILSSACYVPMLLQQSGFAVPEPLLYLRYFFVPAPALVSILFLAGERRVKTWFAGRFRRISPKELAVCAAAAAAGGAITCWYSAAQRVDLFGGTYRTPASLAASCAYLFVTALAEEAAWRGFLLRRVVSRGGGQAAAVGLTGIAWALWHIPMWAVRNSLGPAEIVPLLLWAVLISGVLGSFYCAYENLLSVSLLHMAVNICFLAPAAWNSALLLGGILICCAFKKYRRG